MNGGEDFKLHFHSVFSHSLVLLENCENHWSLVLIQLHGGPVIDRLPF